MGESDANADAGAGTVGRDGEYTIANAVTRDGDAVDVTVDGTIERIDPAGTLDPAAADYDAGGRLVTRAFTEPHFHLDAALTAGEPRWNREGTLAAGIGIWGEYKSDLTAANVRERARRVAEWLAAHGVTRVRSHVDVTEPTLAGVEALVDLRETIDVVDVELVAFPQDGVFTDPDHPDLLREAIGMGVDVVGGAPHVEHTREDGVESIRLALDLAEEHGLPVDLHVDETDDPGSRFTEVLASEALKRGIGDRTVASHATAMHSYPNAYADKLIRLLAESGVSVVTNPPDNAVLQGRYDDYPRRRGHTRIDELRAAGVTVGLGHDSVMDPWYHYGRGDPLDAAGVLLHYAHMNGYDDVGTLWGMLTADSAAVVGAPAGGVEPGAPGSLVVFDSPTPFDALRTRAARTLVLKDGRPVARTEPARTTVRRGDGTERTVDFHR